MQNELINLARPEIVEMKAYRSARSENTKGNIWLDANENALTDSRYYQYPMPQPRELVTLLSLLYGIFDNQILITRGIDEGIDLLIRLFCRNTLDKIMICPPTYGMYRVSAQIQGIEIVSIPLIKSKDFSLNCAEIVKEWRPEIKLIFLCSPNNPTGNLLKAADVLKICDALQNKALIIIDEAYIEFSNSESFTKYINNYPNLIILRTLSKAYGLAGIRCGATIAHPDIIHLLKKIIAPYPIPTPIAEIVLNQLQNTQLSENVQTIQKERDKIISFLKKIKMVKSVWKSDANFILFEVEDAKQLMSLCLKKGIVIRDRSFEYNLNNCVRVSIGKIEENSLFMEVIKNA